MKRQAATLSCKPVLIEKSEVLPDEPIDLNREIFLAQIDAVLSQIEIDLTRVLEHFNSVLKPECHRNFHRG
jgi:hypothetical protein